MSLTQDSNDHGQGPEARFIWEQHLLGLDDGVEDTDYHSDHRDDPLELGEDLYQATVPPPEPEMSDMDGDTQIEIQRTPEPVLTFAFMPSHHGELYRTYRWTSTFITVDECIWVEPFSDLYCFRGATGSDLAAQGPIPEAGDIVRGFWVRPHDDLLMVGSGRVIAVVYDQEIYLAGSLSM